LRELTKEPPFADGRVPLVGMVSYALVLRRGIEKFIEQAQLSGLSGLIVPDLPLEETTEMVQATGARDVKLIQLVTPTTPPERVARIARVSTGFLYYVSVTGITGERDRLPDDLVQELRNLRSMTDLPICVGFGVSKPEHVRLLRGVADGVIVGSALVRRLGAAGDRPLDAICADIAQLAGSLSSALND
jgi:tryptophan synthase alpha chain